MVTLLPGLQIADGIHVHCLNNSNIRVYVVKTLDGHALDRWIDHVVDGLTACPTGEVYRVVYDFTEISLFGLQAFWAYTIGSMGMTASGKERVRALLTADPHRRAKLAIYTHPTLSAQVMRKLNRAEVDVPFHFFLMMEQAVNWLNREADANGYVANK